MRTEFPSRQVALNVELPRARPPATGIRSILEGVFGLGRPETDSAPGRSGLFRFVHGEDAAPRPMSDDEVGALGDRFSRDVLLKGVRPLTLRDVHGVIAALENPALPLRKMFLVAEGAQAAASGAAFEPNARLVFSWQASNQKPPDILISTVAAAGDPASLLQLVAWSESGGGFQFFERKEGVWIWAGNSFHALSAPSRGGGPFDSHINGALVMKELKEPWSHWHSMDASIDRTIFGAQGEFNTDALFADLEGAQILENIVRAGINRWTRARFARDLTPAGLANLPDYLRQLLWCTSVNLTSSRNGFKTGEAEFDLPTSFFYDIEAIEFLAGAIDLMAEVIPAKRLRVDAGLYRAAVAASGIGVTDDSGQKRRIAGDTHFAFLVPERAAEDLAILIELVNRNVLSARLGLALILVDFANPVFSPARAALLRHVPASVAAGAEGAALDQALVAAIRAADGGAGSPEAEFLALWDHGDLLAEAGRLLADYHGALERRLLTEAGVGDVLALAESRREAVRSTRSLAEFHSTMARGGAPPPHLAMRPDASIFVKTSSLGEGEN